MSLYVPDSYVDEFPSYSTSDRTEWGNEPGFILQARHDEWESFGDYAPLHLYFV